MVPWPSQSTPFIPGAVTKNWPCLSIQSMESMITVKFGLAKSPDTTIESVFVHPNISVNTVIYTPGGFVISKVSSVDIN